MAGLHILKSLLFKSWPVIIILISFIFIIWIIKEREKNAHINKAIFPAFRSIEDYCRKYVAQEIVSQNEFKKCKIVVEQNDNCWDPAYSSCSAEDYYKSLKKLGFDLPTFYEPGYNP